MTGCQLIPANPTVSLTGCISSSHGHTHSYKYTRAHLFYLLTAFPLHLYYTSGFSLVAFLSPSQFSSTNFSVFLCFAFHFTLTGTHWKTDFLSRPQKPFFLRYTVYILISVWLKWNGNGWPRISFHCNSKRACRSVLQIDNWPKTQTFKSEIPLAFPRLLTVIYRW